MERNINIGEPRRQASSVDALRLKEIFFLCLDHWKWFVVSLCVMLGGAVLYLKKTPPVYVRTASILIKSDDRKNGSEESLKELGIVQTSSNLTNEMLFLKTSTVASEIVRRLQLNVEYLRRGTFHKEIIYGVDLPVTVSFLDVADHATASLQLELEADGKVTLSDIRYGAEEADNTLSLSVGDTIQTLAGRIWV